jgi:serine/threonine-protein kinase
MSSPPPGDPAILSGRRAGVYVLHEKIGAGGMGEIYRAHDTRLGRDVAFKVLPPSFVADADRLHRFEREARVLASLNHPHIATIHGIEDGDGVCGIVMELVPGQTLAERLLARRPMSMDEKLGLASQIAEAVEAAHAQGIVHRDLKPANIKITPDGRIKVLDFGLAKAAATEGDETVTELPTRTGIAIGTPAYMSPEQARGETAGPQSDVFSFGVVLYEMLTGISPFRQKTAADTLATLLSTQPNLAALPADTPAIVVRLLRRCLEKDVKRRQHHMGDVRLELDEARTPSAAQEIATGQPHRSRRSSSLKIMGALGLAAVAGVIGLLISVIGFLISGGGPSPAAARETRTSLVFGEALAAAPAGSSRIAIAPDGSRMALAATRRLVARSLDRPEPVTIVQDAVLSPFFSPDGQWIGFFTGTQLRKANVDGSNDAVLADISERSLGGTWCTDGTIVFSTTEGLFQISVDGGTPALLTKPDRGKDERALAWPRFLPGCRALVFTVVSNTAATNDQIVWFERQTGQRKVVLTGASNPQYMPLGLLTYITGQSLKVVGFDAGSGTVSGTPVAIADVAVAVSGDNRGAEYAVSDTGALIVRDAVSTIPARPLEWFDRAGTKETVAIELRRFNYPRVSPDGTRVAVEVSTAGNRDIWILDLARLSLTQLTNGPTEDILPVWSVDSGRVFFASNRTGNFDVYSQPADGATTAKLEFAGPGTQMPGSAIPGGRQLMLYENFSDASVLTFAQPDRLTPALNSGAFEAHAQVSRDGRWMVYESDESGKQSEIFLRPFPNAAARREKVSLDGGRYPLWSPKGDEIFYLNFKAEMMSVPVTLTPELRLGRPVKLFSWGTAPLSTARSAMLYDVSPLDGRFLMVQRDTPAGDVTTVISVVQNWLDGVRQQVSRR